ncbi:nucleolar protein 11-like [Engraulis encrasicolus]|uniref:nucleolar protein 11-like n=1 Tax=Engraulis encrasicolus TaxID=184585 RepID=UPI002FD22F2B
MAALFEGSTLCALGVAQNSTESGIQGIELHGDDDHVIVTNSFRSVTVYKVSDQKPLGNWTVKQGQRITCPAVYNNKTREYVTVTDSKVIRIWKDDDINIDKTFKATVSSDVWRVHSTPCHLLQEPVVLFQTGAVRLLDALLAEPQQEVEATLPEDEAIRWSTLLASGKQQWILYVTEQKGEYFLRVQNLVDSSRVAYRLETTDLSPLSFAASLSRGNIHMLCLYPDGCVYVSMVPMRLPAVAGGEGDVLALPRTLLLRLPLAEGGELGSASAVALDTAHVAVVGVPHPSAGAGKDYLCIWNTNFQTLQAGKEMAGKIYGQLWCYSGKLYVPHGKALSVIPFECQTSSLAAALGKLKQSGASEPTPPLPLPSWGTNVSSSVMDTRRNKLTRKSQGGSTISVDQLIEQIKTAPEEEVLKGVASFLSKSELPCLQLCVGSLARALVTRCLAEPAFYPHKALVQLVHTQCLCHSGCPELLPLALEKRDFALCQFCLQVFPDIPEAVTCACLKAFLGSPDADLEASALEMDSVAFVDGLSAATGNAEEEKDDEETQHNGFSNVTVTYAPPEDGSGDAQPPRRTEEAGGAMEMDTATANQVEKKQDGEEETQQNGEAQPQHQRKPKLTISLNITRPIGLHRAVLLNEILQTPYSDTFLLPHLKDLTPPQVILFLQYLQFLYIKYYQEINTQVPALRSPTMAQIMDWVCLLLDAHFTVLVMAPEAQELLAGLHGFVRAQMKLFTDLGKIEGSLQALKKAKQSQDNSGQYSIEVIELF